MTSPSPGLSEVVARTVQAVAATDQPAAALALVLGACRAAFGAREAVLLRAEGDQLVPVASEGPTGSALPNAAGAIEMSYPLVAAGRVEGALRITASAAGARDAHEVEVAPLLALAALVLQRLRLAEEQARTVAALQRPPAASQQERYQAATLAELMPQDAAEPTLDQVIEVVTEHARCLLSADFAAVALLEPDGRRSFHGVRGSRLGAASWAHAGRAGQGPASRAIAAGRTVVLEYPDPADSAASAGPCVLAAEGARVLLGTPLFHRDRALGALVVGWRSPTPPTAEQVRLAELVASYAATVLANVGAHADLAAQMRALHALAAERTAVLEQMPSGVIVLDAAGQVVFRNAAARRLCGEPSASALRDLVAAHRIRDPVTGRPLSLEELPVTRALAGEEVHDSELLFQPLDASDPLWVQVSAQPLRDPEGRITGALAVFSDVTPSRKLLRELAASEERFRTLYQNVACGILIRDADGRVVDANAAAEQILGQPLAQLRGRVWSPMAEHLVREDGAPAPADERPMVVALRTRRPVHNVTLGLRRPDGERRWIQVDAVPIFGPDGELKQVVTCCIDVTERREVERQRLVLAQTEKLRALGQMAGGVAHDLNQYLGLVAGHAELALHALQQGTADRESLVDSLRTIVQAAMDGAETVKRLLAFARPRQEGPAQRVNLGDLLQEVAKLTAPRWRDAAQAQGRPIHLHLEVDEAVVIEGWPESLREALANLVFNAIDALPHGGTIRLVARRDGAHAVVEVTDSGIGMTPEVQAHIFEPFFSTKGERGTGLGLPMVFGIIQRHGGEIRLESAPGQGTTVRLTFPLAAPAPVAAAGAAPVGGGRPLRILAVDDEPAIARMVALMLEPDGHAVTVATSGEEALARLAEAPFDLVISDLGMGSGMNGWELAEHVRARYPRVRFALATGWGAQIDPAEARAYGVSAVIAKPYRLVDLRRLIQGAS
jgi:PAS domain S-box-containing protein